ncbi:MAG TPA: FtsX-like permease family protein, partial [Gemmatimonadetes bacterium]|nr:FtsX-like permease family protein [Gemmatimonadota bacterium]
QGSGYVEGENRPSTAMRVVRAGYFETMGIPVLRGRAFIPSDGESDGVPPALINEALAREAFPNTEPVGREMIFGDANRVLVVGVVGDVLQSDLRTTVHPEMYVPSAASPWRRFHMVMRVDGEAAGTLAAVASAARSVDAEVALLGPRLMTDVVDGTMGNARLMTSMLALLALFGLGLGAIGVYGVTAQVVSERRKEIGIRIALGAERTRVARRTIVQGLFPVGLGVAVGLLASYSGAGLLEDLVFWHRDPRRQHLPHRAHRAGARGARRVGSSSGAGQPSRSGSNAPRRIAAWVGESYDSCYSPTPSRCCATRVRLVHTGAGEIDGAAALASSGHTGRLFDVGPLGMPTVRVCPSQHHLHAGGRPRVRGTWFVRANEDQDPTPGSTRVAGDALHAALFR